MPVATAWRTREAASPARERGPDPRAGWGRRPGRIGRPAPGTERRFVARPALAALGVLLIIGCATGGALLAGRADHNQPYLVVGTAIEPGATVAASDLTVVALDPPPGVDAVPAAEESTVLGEQAQHEIPAGSLLDPSDLSTGPALFAGAAVVGASLASDQLPDELAAGNEVLVVYTSSAGGTIGGGIGNTGTATPGAGSSTQGPSTTLGGGSSPGAGAVGAGQAGAAALGTVLATALVLDVVQPGSSAAGAGAAAGSLATVSLAVPQRSAALVTAASAANEISLALLPPTPAPTPKPTRAR